MAKFIAAQKDFWNQADIVISAIGAVIFLLLSLVINYFAGTYATIHASNPVTDIILSNIPVVNTEPIFVQGILIFVVLVACLLIIEPKRIPFALKSIALWVVVRSMFISLTHIAPYPEHAIVLSNNIINKFTFGADLFFSGHTGLPFLIALMFWNHKRLRYTFIAASIIFAVAVLLGHLHYSIDVFAAYFITDGIFRIGEKLFAKDYQTFLTTL
ncbi:hypothetical protein KGO95_00315 [Patescibacteria group bacterium]|nr:hypothetical protein [Patescibacteria group bacterium]